jgi:hypothetical protein
MIKTSIAAASLLVLSQFALAQSGSAADSSDLSTKAAKDAPATSQDGMTAQPTAKPKSDSLEDKSKMDAPGTTGGTTDMPTAKPKSDDLGSTQGK